MGRAPCCEKMGLKRGPWTPEEDRALVAHIERHGHSNWRALPKQAGLLRCGKSCRLRWINYLRPDIKRGNFSREEEDAIIQLHQMLGNRWSAIAARLPGRTDNEIKNVWHTHLKKRLEPTKPASQAPKRKPKKQQQQPEAVTMLEGPTATVPVSAEQSLSTSTTSTTTDYSAAASSMENADSFTSEEEDYQIDDSFWSETLAMTVDSSDDSGMQAEGSTFGASSTSDDDMDFWLKLFMQASDMQNLAQI
ncbi:unnamed protein product [Miscanthus lutarioriparius]|uniref:Uncharacterized protein n=1 Tax=Miscanthus lutarioriparius TaxID=422564 RepID=A0A811Q2U7_9POAL|nr:unnamed protein product [Miscanthus lutarioriparius]